MGFTHITPRDGHAIFGAPAPAADEAALVSSVSIPVRMPAAVAAAADAAGAAAPAPPPAAVHAESSAVLEV
jgi:hypothetical protein